MNVFNISCLIGTICSFGLTFFFFLWKGKKHPSTLLFAGFTFSSGIWNLGAFIFTNFPKGAYNLAFYWMQFAYLGAIFAPPIFFHFIVKYLELTKRRLKRIAYALYLLAFIFVFFNYYNKSQFFLGDLRFVFDQFYWLDALKYRNPIFFFFYISFYWLTPVYSFFLLWRAFRNSIGVTRNKLKYFILAVGLGWLGTNPLWLAAFHIDVYPYTNFLVALYPLLVAYVIIRHQVMDIEVIIKKTLVYSILISTITIIYIVTALFIEHIFKGIIGYKSLPITILTITLLVIVFQPLKNYIQRIIDKYFFHGSIDQINAENIRLRDELQKTEKLKAVATLAAGMAHEIKNPLTGIKTFTEYLPKKHNNPDFIKKFQKIVGTEVDRINYIVKQLLEFAKPSELKLKKIDINKLLDETSDLLNNHFLKFAIKIEKIYSPLPQIQIDPVQMKQVFLNIFLNAIDSMHNGGILTIKTEIKENNRVSIKIKDTGKGIEKEDLKRIFDPFFSKKDGGTGLGLNVVHGIITKHTGKINVQSTPGKGTSFEILLPAEAK